MFYKSVIGNNLMMTSYFSCLLECTECYSIFLVRRHFSKLFFRDGHDKLVLTLNLLFTAFSRYFCTLIFPRSFLSCRCRPSLSSGLVKVICALGTSVTVKHLIKKASSAMPNFTKSASELFDCYSLQLDCDNVTFTLLTVL